jgi:hypothetical protein
MPPGSDLQARKILRRRHTTRALPGDASSGGGGREGAQREAGGAAGGRPGAVRRLRVGVMEEVTGGNSKSFKKIESFVQMYEIQKFK